MEGGGSIELVEPPGYGHAGGGAHLTKPGWSKPHTHSNPTNLALFRYKITLYRFNQGGSYYCRGLKSEQGAEPPGPPHFNRCIKLFFWIQAADNVTNMLAVSGLSSFRTVMHNCKISFLICRNSCSSHLVSVLRRLGVIYY